MGTLIKNNQCQLADCSNQPLNVGPIAGTTIADSDHRLMANGLRSFGIAWNIMVMVQDMISPLQDPRSIRKIISDMGLQATAHRKGKIVKPKEFCQKELDRYKDLLKDLEVIRNDQGESLELKATVFGRNLLTHKRIMDTEASLQFCEWAFQKLESEGG